jgi:NAD/NADP transhydrogenase beta subunit
MRSELGSLRGVSGLGLTWGFVWAVVAVVVGTAIGVVDPESIDPGEEPHVLAPMIGLAGVICGLVFAALVALAERQTLLDLSPGRAVIWGTLVAGALPLVMGKDVRMVLIIGPVGAISAVASVAAARAWERWRAGQSTSGV